MFEMPTRWKWIEGTVDTGKNHFRISYGRIEGGGITNDIRRPLALVGQCPDQTFVVQFLVERNKDVETDAALAAICRELDFYLVEKGELSPWAYAIHHSGTASNLYSSVHWTYCPVESRKR